VPWNRRLLDNCNCGILSTRKYFIFFQACQSFEVKSSPGSAAINLDIIHQPCCAGIRYRVNVTGDGFSRSKLSAPFARRYLIEGLASETRYDITVQSNDICADRSTIAVTTGMSIRCESTRHLLLVFT